MRCAIAPAFGQLRVLCVHRFIPRTEIGVLPASVVDGLCDRHTNDLGPTPAFVHSPPTWPIP